MKIPRLLSASVLVLSAEDLVAQRDGCHSVRGSTSSIVVASADEPGERLLLRGRVVDRQGQARAGVEVRVYHTDAAGYYSRGGMDESQARLCGVFRSADDGGYDIDTILPGAYATGGPSAHIHFQVVGGKGEFFTLTWRARTGDPAAGNRTTSPRPLVKTDDGVWVLEYDLIVDRV
jgi:protocatechuate 3,4-dioxygenase beta subunit